MAIDKDGGPAFPPDPGSQYSGMPLRDWFAGQALALAHKEVDPEEYARPHAVATLAYAIADAMLVAREGK
jgi:hypothetical protein